MSRSDTSTSSKPHRSITRRTISDPPPITSARPRSTGPSATISSARHARGAARSTAATLARDSDRAVDAIAVVASRARGQRGQRRDRARRRRRAALDLRAAPSRAPRSTTSRASAISASGRRVAVQAPFLQADRADVERRRRHVPSTAPSNRRRCRTRRSRRPAARTSRRGTRCGPRPTPDEHLERRVRVRSCDQRRRTPRGRPRHGRRSSPRCGRARPPTSARARREPVDRLDRALRSPPGANAPSGVDALTEPRDRPSAVDACISPSSTSATSSRTVFVPTSIAATRTAVDAGRRRSARAPTRRRDCTPQTS